MTVTTTAAGRDELDDQDIGGQEAEARTQLSHDVVFHVLQNERRRLVLRYLQGRDEPVRMGDVAEQVAAWEHDTTVEQLTSKQRQRVYIPLYQNHLTKLDEERIIDYNQSRGIVERRPAADQFDPYLDAGSPDPGVAAGGDAGADESPEESSDPWGKYYLGVSVLGTALVASKTSGFVVLSSLSGVLVSAMVLTAFSLVTMLQLTAPLWQA